MKIENKRMKEFLSANGIEATPKFLAAGSIKGCWRLYNHKVEWFDNTELQEKLTALGFTNYEGKPLNNFSGNGGRFSVFVRHAELTQVFVYSN